MASARRLYRLNLVLGALGVLTMIVVLGSALPKLSLAPPSLEDLLAACGRFLPTAVSPLAGALLALAALGVLVLARGLRSVLVHALAHTRVHARLRFAVEMRLAGSSAGVFQSPRPQAFCAGLLRPRIFLSAAARNGLSAAELRAVMAHEGHHVCRRDPLRLLAARVLADALFFVPALRRLERRYAELAELAADEAAVRVAGPAALASALIKLGTSDHPEGTVAIAPERVDHLCGASTRWRLEPRILVLSLLAIGGTAGMAIVADVAAAGLRVEVLAVVVQSCMALMLVVVLAGMGALWRRRVEPSCDG